MKKKTIIGLLLIVLGVAMLMFGASMFTYQGNSLNAIVSKLGMYCFFLWLPVIIIGIVFITVRSKK
jgi:hypothetical protein